MDTKIIVQEIIKNMRADKSQDWINKRMNVSSNIINRWEKGHSKVKWNDFCEFCTVVDFDLKKSLNDFFRYSDEGRESEITGPELIKHILSTRDIEDVEKKCGLSKTKINRITSGQTQLTFDVFLTLYSGIDPQEFLGFCYHLSQGKSIPTLDKIEEERLRVSNEYLRNPLVGLVLVSLHLPQYKQLSFHQDSFIEKVTGIPIKEVNEIIKFCEENNIVKKKNGIYEMGEFRISDRGDRELMLEARRYWMRKAIDKSHNASQKDVFGSMIFNASDKARGEIVTLYLKFFEDMKKIIDADDNEKSQLPLLLNFQLFTPVD